jgi:cytochrome c peroxidase
MIVKTGIKLLILTAIMPVFILFSCEKATTTLPQQNALLEVPKGFPPIPFPEDNRFSEARWELGKKLFYDTRMSLDGTISCASCHAPQLAFADTQAFSPGVFNRPGVRNAPSLANVAYQPYFLREGAVPSLEMQVLVPIQETNEFNHNIVDLAEEIAAIPKYVQLSQEAYNRNPDAFVITSAIATFERTLVSGNSLYDQFLNGNTDALSESQKRGMELFFGTKTNCSSCHMGFNFTDYSFENNGLYANYPDMGRERLTNNPADRALFKTPSLRNVAVTPPYMHDGSLKTLEEVVAHYNTGGAVHPNKSPLVTPLQLKQQEMADIVSFLESLTDESFIQNPVFYP